MVRIPDDMLTIARDRKPSQKWLGEGRASQLAEKPTIRIRVCLQAYRVRRVINRAFRRCGAEFNLPRKLFSRATQTQ